MHAVLTPVGSSGDINPFVIVGRELHRRGHRVTLIAPAVFGDTIANAGLEFVGVGTAEDYERVTNDPALWHPRLGPRLVFRELALQLRPAYAAIDSVYRPGETVLVGHSLSLSTRVFEEHRSAPAVTIHLSPGVFRSDFEQAALPSGLDISGWPRWTKRTLWWVIDRVGVDPLIAPALNAWRAELGLPPVRRVLRSWFHSPQRVIGLFPGWFAQPQRDWPPQTRLTGFALSDDSCSPVDRREFGDALDAFLAAGDAPIVFTPGSANRFAAEFLQAGIDAADRIGRRALLVTKYRDHVPATLPPHAFHTPYAPFVSLFPRAAAVVHHGGIGTCAQGLAAGVPQLIMPMGFDQPDNAARLARLGVGEALPPARFTADRVAAALSRLLSDAHVRASAERWQGTQRRSDALAQTCDLIEHVATRREGNR